MRNILIAVVAVTCCLWAASFGLAQGPPGACVGFRSEAKTPLIVQGYSVVRGMQMRGQPLFMDFGKMAFENNVPAGVRYYTIYDRNQPSRVLLRDFAVPVRDDNVFLSIRSAPNNPMRLHLVPGPPP